MARPHFPGPRGAVGHEDRAQSGDEAAPPKALRSSGPEFSADVVAALGVPAGMGHGTWTVRAAHDPLDGPGDPLPSEPGSEDPLLDLPLPAEEAGSESTWPAAGRGRSGAS